MSAEGDDERSAAGIRVIARAADVLRALEGAEEGMSLTELADKVGLPRSTVHRMASALAEEHVVLWTSPRGPLRLGPGLIPLANVSRRSPRDIARPALQALSRRLNETAELAVPQGGSILVLDQVVAPQRLRLVSSIGARFPVHCRAGGKALLAELTDDGRAGRPDNWGRKWSTTTATCSPTGWNRARSTCSRCRRPGTRR
jgi:IclR family transcriptional regulator, acetate operon repressor